MKKIILLLSFSAGALLAQSNHTALFMTRVSTNPEKTATMAGFQILFGITVSIPAVAFAIKAHQTHSTSQTSSVASYTALGTIAGGISIFLIQQGLSNLADAAASTIWSTNNLAPVKIP